MKYFSINLYRKMLNCAIAEGLTKENFSHFPIPYEAIDDAQAILADDFFLVHELLDEQLGPGFGVRVGQQMKIDDYGVLGLSWRTCSYVGEIFERSERYFKLLSNTFVWQIKEEGTLSHVHLNRAAYRRGLELSTEASLSATVVVLQAMTEKNIQPVQVAFKHQSPKDLTSFHAAFQCPILFNQPHYAISYTTADLKTRTAKADASINRFLIERVEEATNGLEIVGSKLVVDVENLIKDALPSGIPSINQLGKHIGMSSRTLTRRLSEQGTTFRALVKKTQEETATSLLHTPSKSISEIAFLTGFSEQSAFNRAFKRWTGKSPTAYRKMV
ncbi:MAG: AraC family transcriptional regulator ligand-binding domain-containing protein [Bacteroidota bacterium]